MHPFVLSFLVVSFLASFTLHAQSSMEWIATGDRLLSAGKPAEALNAFRRAESGSRPDATLFVRMAKACVDQSLIETDEDVRLSWSRKAVNYATKAVTASPQSSIAHAHLAVSYGQVAVDAPAREKMDLSLLLKKHAVRALELDPNNFVAMIVLGIWHREIANLNWALKLALRMVYDEIPTASFAEAKRLLARASQLHPEVILPGLELAKTLILMDDSEGALRELRRIAPLPARDAGDPARLREVRSLIRTLSAG